MRTPRSKEEWRVHCKKYRNEKKVLRNVTKLHMRGNTPDSEVSNLSEIPTPEVAEIFWKQYNREKMLRYKEEKR